jgi:hypothetical protein
VASITGAAFAGIWNQTAGTVYSDIRRPSAVPSGYPRAWQASASTSANSIQHNYYSGGQVNEIRVSGVLTAEWYPAIFAENGVRVALAFSTDDASGASNGVITGSDTSMTLPTVDRIFFGSDLGVGNFFNGYIREFAIFNKRLPNSVLKAMTE